MSMKNEALRWIACGTSVLGAMGLCGLTLAGEAQSPRPPVHFHGLIDDSTPAHPTVKNGPYVMHSKWTLDVDERQGTAIFSAEMNMETSDYGIFETVPNPADPTGPPISLVNKDDPTTRGAHTHHMLMTNGMITTTDWATSCPTFSPAAKGGFVVRGSVSITGNGSSAPFGNPSPLTLCILGGLETIPPAPYVLYSNLTLLFGAPANTHFGKFPIHGVVLGCAAPWEFQSKDCTVQE
jgi:hypothetical protein